MLEEKTYTINELAEELKMKPDSQGIKRKLLRKGITFQTIGRGKKLSFQIEKIPSPFEFFCITELGFDSKTDLKKVCDLFYYCFNDEEFFAMPNEFKESKLDDGGKRINSATIAKYLNKLYSANYYTKGSTDYYYYFADGNKRAYTTREEYLDAWHDYWQLKSEVNVYFATAEIKRIYGGFPRKHAIPERNAIENKNINLLIHLTNQRFEEEIAKAI